MFKIKFPQQEKNIIKQTLGIVEADPYDIVLCPSPLETESDKINIVFELHNLSEMRDKIHFFSHVSPILLSGRTRRGEMRVDISQINYIESFGNDVFAYTDKQEIELPYKLYEIIEQLESLGFCRIGKSQIVNVVKIEAVDTAFNGKLTLYLHNDVKLEVNRSYAKAFRAFLKGR